jgi:hypothetical protein
MSVTFTPQRLDFGADVAGSTGPLYDPTSNDPDQLGRVGFLNPHPAAPAANITASIKGDPAHFKVIRVTVYNVIVAHGIHYHAVGSSDGVKPLAVSAGQSVSVQLEYDLKNVTATFNCQRFNATLEIHGDTPGWAPDCVIPLTVSVLPLLPLPTTGTYPWAVILCQFSDITHTSRPLSFFQNYISESGRCLGGALDYWYEMSNGSIDFTGSAVYGPFVMKYSYAVDGQNPKGPKGDGNQPRYAWFEEAIRLAVENSVPLQQYKAVLAVVNAPVDDSALQIGAGALPNNLYPEQSFGKIVLNFTSDLGQGNWRWCHKCQGIVYSASPLPAKCSFDGGAHDLTEGFEYLQMSRIAGFPGQDNWRWCTNCNLLVYAGINPGACTGAGGQHIWAGNTNFTVPFQSQTIAAQAGWRWCHKCQGMFYAYLPPSPCPADNLPHDFTQSSSYAIILNTCNLNGCQGFHEMGHAIGLEHSWRLGTGGNPNVEYGDQWDLMSASNVYKFFSGSPFDPSGPGLNGPNLLQLNCLPAGQVLQINVQQLVPSVAQPIALTALNATSDVPRYRVCQVDTGNGRYTIELRQPTGWDRGIPRMGVLIHLITDHDYLVPQPQGTDFDWQSGQSFMDTQRNLKISVVSINASQQNAVVNVGLAH